MRARRAAVLLLALLPGPLAGQGSAPVREATVEGVAAYRFDNGLRLLLAPDRSQAALTVQVTYFVGSRHEGYGESGMAHLLEHLVFKGTPTHPDIPAELAERGASPNGTTHPDRTSYHETLPATEENLEWALAFEADRMVHSTIAAADLATEMPVVLNEFEAGENSAVNVLRQRVMAAAFPWHNYGRPTIGTPSDVAGVPIERLRAFYRRYYQPDNALVVVAGGFDPRRALEIARRTLGAIPAPARDGANRLWPTHTREPAQDGERGVALRRPADAEAVILGWHVPGAGHPDAAALEVLAQLLGAPGTGRLFLSVLAPGIGANITAYPVRLREPGMLIAQAVLRRGDPAEAARDAMFQAIGRLQTSAAPTDTEVERGKAVLLKAIATGLRDPAVLATQLGEWQAMGDWRLLFVHRDRIRAVTAADVARVAARYLRPSNMTVGILKPTTTPGGVEIPAVDGVAAAVEGYRGEDAVLPGEPLDVQPAALEARTIRTTLSGGVRLAQLPHRTRGAMVTARLVLRFGRDEELAGKGTVAEMAGQLLMRGTIGRDRQQLTDAITRLEADLDVRGSATAVVATLRAPRAQFPAALRLMLEVLRHPRFDEREFEVLRQARIAILDQQRSDPQAIAVRTMRRHLSPWPAGSPGHVPSASEERQAIAAVTLEAVREFHATHYGASRGEVAIVGDFDPDAVRDQLEATLEGWESAAPYAAVRRRVETVAPIDTTIVVPGRANAFLLLGRRIPLAPSDAEFPALVIADYLLGGGFLNSRLAVRLRQREGLSYGVRSELATAEGDSASTWIAMVIHAPGNLVAVRTAVVEELARAAREGFGEAEVRQAIGGWLAARQLQRADDAVLASRLLDQEARGQSWHDEAALEARIAALGREALREVVARQFDPERLSVVAVGAYRPPGGGTPP